MGTVDNALTDHELKMLKASLIRARILLGMTQTVLQSFANRLEDLTRAVERVKP